MTGFSRRDFLVSALALPQLAGLSAQTPGLIDVHHHIGQRNPAASTARTRQSSWSPQGAIEELDRHNVSVAVLSAAAGGGGSTTGAVRRKQSRDWNESAAQLVRDHRGRFGLFATLPLPDVEGSLVEIAYAFDTLKAHGIGLVTSYGDKWLGDAAFSPVMDELNRRKAVVYVHPTDAPCCTPETMTYWKPGMNGSWLEWPMHTARTIFSLMANGMTRDRPDLRWIFSHSGGVAPLLITRLSGFAAWDSVGPEGLQKLFPDGIETEFRKLYFEIAQGFAPGNLEALMRLVPASHVVFGSDYPFFSVGHSVKGLADLKLPAPLTRGIERDNALALLPSLR